MRAFLAWLGQVAALPVQLALLVLVVLWAGSAAGLSLEDLRSLLPSS